MVEGLRRARVNVREPLVTLKAAGFVNTFYIALSGFYARWLRSVKSVATMKSKRSTFERS